MSVPVAGAPGSGDWQRVTSMQMAISGGWIDATRATGGLEGMTARADDMGRPLGLLGIHLVRKTAGILRSGARGVRTLHSAGGLAASLTSRIEGNDLTIGSNKAYARVQQRGGTIESSRPGGFLAIPIADNLGARDPKFARPRDVPGGFFIRTDDPQQVLLVTKKEGGPKGRRGKTRMKAPALKQFAGRALLNVWFLLVRRVRIPAHNYCTFDPPDAERWKTFAMNWITRGK